MKVYEISALAKPRDKRFDDFTPLAADDKVWDFLEREQNFDGRPFNKKWEPQMFYIEKPRLPHPNFYWFGASKFVCDEKARKLAGEALEMSGELLPVRIEGFKQRYWLYNITNCINVTDLRKSKWKYLGAKREHRILERPAFIPARFGEESIFKIPEDRGAAMYCVERTGDADDGEFKALVEHHDLTGLVFELVWSNNECKR